MICQLGEKLREGSIVWLQKVVVSTYLTINSPGVVQIYGGGHNVMSIQNTCLPLNEDMYFDIARTIMDSMILLF